MLALGHDRDSSISLPDRMRVFSILIVLTAAIAIVLTSLGTYHHIRNEQLLAIALGFLAVLSVTVFALRKSLLSNEYNRQVISFPLLCTASIALNRTVALLHDTPVAQVLSVDYILVAGCCLMAATTVMRYLLWSGVFFALCAPLSMVVPDAWVQRSFSLAIVIGLSIGLANWRMTLNKNETD